MDVDEPVFDYDLMSQTITHYDTMMEHIRHLVRLIKSHEAIHLKELPQEDHARFLDAAKKAGFHDRRDDGPDWGVAAAVSDLELGHDYVEVRCHSDLYRRGCHVGSRRETFSFTKDELDLAAKNINDAAQKIFADRLQQVQFRLEEQERARGAQAEAERLERLERDRQEFDRLSKIFGVRDN